MQAVSRFPWIARAVFSLTVVSMAQAKVIYVDDDATGANDGTSWGSAYRYLQDALAEANESTKPVEIRVAQGVYCPDLGVNQIPGDREATFHLIDGVSLLGGYAGLPGPDPNRRDVRAHETTLSGEIGGGRFATVEDNSYHVLSIRGFAATVTVDGLTITGGNASGSGSYSGGGGLFNHNSSLTAANCLFRANSAGVGGGLYNRDGSVVLVNCHFAANRAFQWGGGLCSDNGELDVAHCSFGGNLGTFGGGICDADSPAALTNCTFFGNAALQGGGVHYAKAVYTNPQVYHVTRRFTVQNETAHVDRIEVWLPMAMECDSQRDVLDQEVVPGATDISHQPLYGSEVRYWDFPRGLGQDKSLSLVERFTYTAYAVHHQIDPTRIGAYDQDDPVMEVYTRASKYIETNDPRMIQTARQVVGGQTNPYWAAYSAYLWVMHHMTYRSVPGLQGAKFALDKGYGECGDYAALFVALCRVVGIPARPVVGRWARSSPGGWHVWSEFYLPGYGWIPVDAERADGTGRPEDHFGRLDNTRMIFNKTYDVLLRPSPHFFSPDVGFLQTYSWEYHGSAGVVRVSMEYDVQPMESGAVAGAAGRSRFKPVMANCIMWGNSPDQIYAAVNPPPVRFTDIQGGWPGDGNIDADPLSADPQNGDYHLKSQAGRWDSGANIWVVDDVTSPCIDAGDPSSPVALEPIPNGGIVNMGAYGGTIEASKSP